MIHQIYCTHCTYGTSALERRQGELAARTLGYTARAGSLPPDQLRQLFGRVERSLYYHLPRGAPAEDKLRLTAATAPRRLVFFPSAGGLQVAAQVCYRPADSEGRPGSYFAHVLVRGAPWEATPTDPAWSPLDVLRLWQAPGWVEQDSPDAPFDLAPLASLEEMLAGHGPAIDDRVLLSFLTAGPGIPLDDPCGVVPPRWGTRPAAERRALVCDALAALFVGRASRPGPDGPGGPSDGAHGDPGGPPYPRDGPDHPEPLLLVAEPSLAALVFYAVARLLSEGALRGGLSFSTYEPDPDRPGAALSATLPADPQRTDLRPEACRAAVVLNTFLSGRSGVSDAGPAYPDLAVSRLVEGGWPALDATLARMSAAGARRFEDLSTLAAIEIAVPALVRSGDLPRGVRWRVSPAAAAYFRERLARALTDVSSPETQLTALVGRPAQMFVLETLSDTGASGAGPALEFLARNVPTDRIADLLRYESVRTEQKVEVLARHVAARGELPPGCEWLWTDEPLPSPFGRGAGGEGASLPSPPSGRGDGGEGSLTRNLLPRAFARLDGRTLQRLQRHTPPAYADRFLPALIRACRYNASHVAVLGRIVEAMPEDSLFACLRGHGRECLGAYPADEPALGRRLHAALASLSRHLPQFQARLDAILAGVHLLPDRRGRATAGAWEQVRRAIVEIGALQSHRGAARHAPLEEACRRMCQAASAAMPSETFPDDAHGTAKLDLLRTLGPRLLAHERLLPETDWLHRALWQKARWYFETGHWPAAPLGRMRPAGLSWARTWAIAGLIAAAVALIAACVFWGLAGRRAEDPVPRPPASRATIKT